MKKYLLLTICIALMATLCVGSLNAQNNLPFFYSEGFEGTTIPDLPTGWTQSTPSKWRTLDNFANHPNMTENFAPHTGERMMVAVWTNSGDNWAFSPGFMLHAGESYTISFWYSDMGYQPGNEADNFEVRIGETATADDMSTAQLVFTQGNIVNGWDYLWKKATYIFTPTTIGLYYLGFHDLRPAGSGLCIAIDDIEITDASDCEPATNLDVVYFGDCSAALKWDAPVTSGAEYNIYRDELLVIANHTETSYTDFGFDATQTHIWSVKVVCNDGSETEPVSKEMPICNISVNENDKTSFSIVPNPVTKELTIDNGQLTIESVEIFDVFGRNVFTSQFSILNSKFSVDISHLQGGVYFVRITSEAGASVQKFVKQ
jgi:hypothetical protein